MKQTEPLSACVIDCGSLQTVVKDHRSNRGFPDIVQVFACCCRVMQADSACEESALLVNLLHHVPKLRDFLDGNSLGTLILISREIRDQAIWQQVHRTQTAQNPDWCHLSCSNWAGLRSLDVWSPRVNAEIVGSCANKWPLLQAFSTPLAKLRPSCSLCPGYSASETAEH